jgi:polysaccharide export outer membrane protein
MFLSPGLSVAQNYTIHEGDVIRITVYDHDDLTTVERVSDNGTINFPLIGRVRVAGMTGARIADKISSQLSDGYIVFPQVSVFREEFRTHKAAIMGEVNKPSLYDLKGEVTFMELVSMAGGLTNDAGETATVKRATGTDGSERVITINMVDLIEAGDASLDIQILDGDSVYIPKAGVYYVTGEVKKPDSYRFKEGTNVIQAITNAGGFTSMASAGRVKIIRKVDGVEVVIKKVKMDALIMPNDVIVVPESFF